MTQWKRVHKATTAQPSPWRLHATELIHEIVATADRIAAARSFDGQPIVPTGPQWQLLGAIERAVAPTSMSDVARALSISRQAARELVIRAARDGQVHLDIHRGDRRVVLVDLAPRARLALTAARAREGQWVIPLLNGLELREMEAVARILRVIRHRLLREERWRRLAGGRVRRRHSDRHYVESP